MGELVGFGGEYMGGLAAELTQALSRFVNNPIVTVTLGTSSTLRFYVVGEVNKPGEFPLVGRTTVMQALALAGGVDKIADPPYATVFRKSADGRILPGTFEIYGDGLTQSSVLPIKPGDVIVVEHTLVTWTRSLLAQIL